MARMITDNPPMHHSHDNARTARQLLRAHRYGALCTLSQKFDGHPFGSITPYLVDHDGSLLILISDLAEHTKNIKADPRVSLITHNQADPHIQTQGRVTVVGRATQVADRDGVSKRYLRYFPEAQTYFAMHDFQFYRIAPQAIRFIGGFGNIHWVQAERYSVPPYALIAEEDALLDELNAQRTAAQGVMIGIDCDGYDVRTEEDVARTHFDEVVLNGAQARAMICRGRR
jgi:putative heme iron utilization protein